MSSTSPTIDESLIQRAQAGVVADWERLICGYQDDLYDYIQRRHCRSLTNLASVDDILQDALLEAWLNISTLKQTTPSSFAAWLRVIADRRVFNVLRTQSRQKRGGDARRATGRNSSGCWDDLLSALPAEAKTASSVLSHKEAIGALRAAVGNLPEDQQTAIRLHCLEAKSLNETADEMNRTAAAVRGLVHRSKTHLAEILASASSWWSASAGANRRATRLMSGAGSNRKAADELLSLVYDELRVLAAQKLRHEKLGQTLQATALVHEAYMRLLNTGAPPQWDSEGHFFAAAAEAMRRILIDRARRKQSQRRGGNVAHCSLDKIEIGAAAPDADFLTLNEALQRFEEIHPRKAAIVKLRYFAGLTVVQAAQAAGVSTTTADRYWAYARAWLHTELKRQRQ